MSARHVLRYTARQLHEFATSYLADADWYRWHATRSADPREAERDIAVAGALEAKGNGFRFRAREMAYDADGGRR